MTKLTIVPILIFFFWTVQIKNVYLKMPTCYRSIKCLTVNQKPTLTSVRCIKNFLNVRICRVSSKTSSSTGLTAFYYCLTMPLLVNFLSKQNISCRKPLFFYDGNGTQLYIHKYVCSTCFAELMHAYDLQTKKKHMYFTS